MATCCSEPACRHDRSDPRAPRRRLRLQLHRAAPYETTRHWDLRAAPAIAAVLAVAALILAARRRWGAGLGLVAGSVLMLGAHVVWTGAVFLRNEWRAPCLAW